MTFAQHDGKSLNLCLSPGDQHYGSSEKYFGINSKSLFPHLSLSNNCQDGPVGIYSLKKNQMHLNVESTNKGEQILPVQVGSVMSTKLCILVGCLTDLRLLQE